MKKIVHVIFGFIGFMSFIYVLGLAGASDCDIITWNALWPRVIITSFVMIISFVIWFYTDVANNNKKNKYYYKN